MMQFFYRMTYLGLDLGSIKKLGIFPKTSCTTQTFKKFILASKEGHYTSMKDALLDDRYLVYHYDFVN